MHKPMTEEKMALEIRRAKRFNDIAFAVTIIFAAALIFFLCRFQRYTTFSPRRWKTDQTHRSYMMESLLSQHKLYNMEKDKLIDLLGYDQHKWDSDRKNQLTYYLGTSAATGADRWFIVELQADRVSRYRIYTE